MRTRTATFDEIRSKIPKAREVLIFAREHMAGYKIPRSISFAESIPRNGSGKILKKELRKPLLAGHDRGVA
jgi:acyl-CoA synthetase (AMP-forming)/AMP-acid ligase II